MSLDIIEKPGSHFEQCTNSVDRMMKIQELSNAVKLEPTGINQNKNIASLFVKNYFFRVRANINP